MKEKLGKTEKWIQIFISLPITFSRTYIRWCFLHIHLYRLYKQHVHMWCLKFGQRQMCCWYLYFYLKTLFKIVFSSMGRCSIQYVWYLSLSGIYGLPNVFSFIDDLVINVVAKKRKFIKVSFVLRKCFIARYAFTSAHTMKKEKIGWASKLSPIHTPN